MARARRPLFCRENGKRQLIRFVIFLGVLAWSFVVFKFFIEHLNISDAIAEIKENRVVAFGFLSSMLLTASLYTYLVHWHIRRFMGPCLVKSFWGILYMIPIVNLFLSKEAMQDIKEDWKNIGETDYFWDVDFSGFLPFVGKFYDVNQHTDKFFVFIFSNLIATVLNIFYGIFLLITSLVLAVLIPVISPVATLMGIGIFSVVPENNMMMIVAVIGLISLALVIFQYAVIPVISLCKKQ
jgi:hypothetical protein